jgi:hypothetical protein
VLSVQATPTWPALHEHVYNVIMHGQHHACYFEWNLQVMQMHLTGSWSAGQVKEGLELAMGGCQQLRGLMRQTLLDAAADDDEESDAAGDDAMQEG